MAQEVDAESTEVVVRIPEQSMPAGRVCPPTGFDSPASIPCGSILHQWLFLSPLQEAGWDQLSACDGAEQ